MSSLTYKRRNEQNKRFVYSSDAYCSQLRTETRVSFDALQSRELHVASSFGDTSAIALLGETWKTREWAAIVYT